MPLTRHFLQKTVHSLTIASACWGWLLFVPQTLWRARPVVAIAQPRIASGTVQSVASPSADASEGDKNDARQDREVAVTHRGRRLQGRLQRSASGGWMFHSRENNAQIPSHRLQRLEFPAERAELGLTTSLWHVELWGRESVPAESVWISDQDVDLVLPGGQRVRASRQVVAAIRTHPAELIEHFQDFSAIGETWRLDGVSIARTATLPPQQPDSQTPPQPKDTLAPPRDPADPAHDEEAIRALQFGPEPGRAVYVVPLPIPAGRLGVRFFDTGDIFETQQWILDLGFATGQAAKSIQILLAGEGDRWTAKAPLHTRLVTQSLRRQRGWHLLVVSFDEQGLRAFIDGAVLFTAPAGMGPLESVRLSVDAIEAKTPLPDTPNAAAPRQRRPVGFIDTVWLTRQAPAWLIHRHVSDQDRMVLVAGEELFGQLVEVDTYGVIFEGRFGRLDLPWREVRGVFLRRQPVSGQPVEGLLVELHWSDAVRPSIPVMAISPPGLEIGEEAVEIPEMSIEPLRGALVAIDERHLHLQHPYLGRMSLPRSFARAIDIDGEGTRFPIDPVDHHLGESVRPEFSAPLPEGAELVRKIDLPFIPAGEPFFTCQVEHLEGLWPGNIHREQLLKGHLQTEVWINGKQIDYLNHYLKHMPCGPRRLQIELPADTMRKGANTLRLRQRPLSNDPKDYDDMVIFDLSLEFFSTRKTASP